MLACRLIVPCCLLLLALSAPQSRAAPIDDVQLPKDPLAEENSDAAPPQEDSPQTPQSSEPQGDAVQLAQEAFGAGDIARCLEYLRAAVAEQPLISPPKISLARFYMAAGKHGAARATLEQCAKEDPDHPDLYLAFGHLALAERRFTDAMLHFQQAMQTETPDHWPIQQRQRLKAGCLLGQVTVAENREHWTQAQDLLKKIVQIDPHNAALRDRWARALFLAGRPEKAYEQFDIAFRQDSSGENPPEVSMGVRNIRAGNYAEANRWYEVAIAKYPQRANIRFEYSVALLFQGQSDKARQEAAKSIELGLKSPALTIHRAQIALHEQRYLEAQTLLLELLEEIPENAQARDLLALALSESPDEETRQKAIQLAEANTENRPNSPKANATLGWVYFRNGRHEDAERHLRMALAGSNSLETLYFAARVLMQQGHRDESQSLARMLANRLFEPGIFLQRQDAREWIAKAFTQPAAAPTATVNDNESEGEQPDQRSGP